MSSAECMIESNNNSNKTNDNTCKTKNQNDNDFNNPKNKKAMLKHLAIHKKLKKISVNNNKQNLEITSTNIDDDHADNININESGSSSDGDSVENDENDDKIDDNDNDVYDLLDDLPTQRQRASTTELPSNLTVYQFLEQCNPTMPSSQKKRPTAVPFELPKEDIKSLKAKANENKRKEKKTTKIFSKNYKDPKNKRKNNKIKTTNADKNKITTATTTTTKDKVVTDLSENLLSMDNLDDTNNNTTNLSCISVNTDNTKTDNSNTDNSNTDSSNIDSSIIDNANSSDNSNTDNANTDSDTDTDKTSKNNKTVLLIENPKMTIESKEVKEERTLKNESLDTFSSVYKQKGENKKRSHSFAALTKLEFKRTYNEVFLDSLNKSNNSTDYDQDDNSDNENDDVSAVSRSTFSAFSSIPSNGSSFNSQDFKLPLVNGNSSGDSLETMINRVQKEGEEIKILSRKTSLGSIITKENSLQKQEEKSLSLLQRNSSLRSNSETLGSLLRKSSSKFKNKGKGGGEGNDSSEKEDGLVQVLSRKNSQLRGLSGASSGTFYCANDDAKLQSLVRRSSSSSIGYPPKKIFEDFLVEKTSHLSTFSLSSLTNTAQIETIYNTYLLLDNSNKFMSSFRGFCKKRELTNCANNIMFFTAASKTVRLVYGKVDKISNALSFKSKGNNRDNNNNNNNNNSVHSYAGKEEYVKSVIALLKMFVWKGCSNPINISYQTSLMVQSFDWSIEEENNNQDEILKIFDNIMRDTLIGFSYSVPLFLDSQPSLITEVGKVMKIAKKKNSNSNNNNNNNNTNTDEIDDMTVSDQEEKKDLETYVCGLINDNTPLTHKHIFDIIVRNELCYGEIEHLLKYDLAVENLLFYVAVRNFKNTFDEERNDNAFVSDDSVDETSDTADKEANNDNNDFALKMDNDYNNDFRKLNENNEQKAIQLIATFIKEDAEYQVNISSHSRKKLISTFIISDDVSSDSDNSLSSNNEKGDGSNLITRFMFDDAQNEVYRFLSLSDSFRKFEMNITRKNYLYFSLSKGTLTFINNYKDTNNGTIVTVDAQRSWSSSVLPRFSLPGNSSNNTSILTLTNPLRNTISGNEHELKYNRTTGSAVESKMKPTTVTPIPDSFITKGNFKSGSRLSPKTSSNSPETEEISLEDLHSAFMFNLQSINHHNVDLQAPAPLGTQSSNPSLDGQCSFGSINSSYQNSYISLATGLKTPLDASPSAPPSTTTTFTKNGQKSNSSLLKKRNSQKESKPSIGEILPRRNRKPKSGKNRPKSLFISNANFEHIDNDNKANSSGDLLTSTNQFTPPEKKNDVKSQIDIIYHIYYLLTNSEKVVEEFRKFKETNSSSGGNNLAFFIAANKVVKAYYTNKNTTETKTEEENEKLRDSYVKKIQSLFKYFILENCKCPVEITYKTKKAVIDSMKGENIPDNDSSKSNSQSNSHFIELLMKVIREILIGFLYVIPIFLDRSTHLLGEVCKVIKLMDHSKPKSSSTNSNADAAKVGAQRRRTQAIIHYDPEEVTDSLPCAEDKRQYEFIEELMTNNPIVPKETFDIMVRNNICLDALFSVLEKDHATENLAFYLAVNRFKESYHNKGIPQVIATAKTIVGNFIVEGAKDQINIDGPATRKFTEFFNKDNIMLEEENVVEVNMFDNEQSQLYKLIVLSKGFKDFESINIQKMSLYFSLSNNILAFISAE